MAVAFATGKCAIRPVLRELFTSPEFHAPASRGTLIKGPVRLLVGACRQLGLQVEPTPGLVRLTAARGQELFNPPDPGGWPDGRDWISAGTLTVRYRLPEALFGGGFDAGRLFPRGVPERPAALVDALLGRTVVAPLRSDTRATLIDACKPVAPADRPALVARLILTTPEYQLA